MESETHKRVSLATQWAQAYVCGGDEVILLSGSAGLGVADAKSDVDIYVFSHSVTAISDRAQLLSNFGLCRLFELPTRRGGRLGRYLFEGMTVDIEHVPMVAVNSTIDAVLVGNEIDPEKQKVIRGLLDAVALCGAEQWRLWCQKLAAYPRQLSVNMLRRHVNFEPLLRLKQRTLNRDDPLAFFGRLVAVMVNIVGTLAGLNKYYLGVAPGILKWTDLHLSRMHNLPTGTAEQLKVSLRDPSDCNLADLAVLISQILDRVDDAFPDVPTRRARSFLMSPHPTAALIIRHARHDSRSIGRAADRSSSELRSHWLSLGDLPVLGVEPACDARNGLSDPGTCLSARKSR